jgi:hypothetical protein
MVSSSSPPQSPNRARRSSRFIEGESLTLPDLHESSSTNEFLVNILSEMDEFEKRRKHSNSNSSAESLPSSNPTSTMSSATRAPVGNSDLQKNFGFMRASLDEKEKFRYVRPSIEETKRPQVEEKLTTKLKGRFRAWTASGKGKD